MGRGKTPDFELPLEIQIFVLKVHVTPFCFLLFVFKLALLCYQLQNFFVLLLKQLTELIIFSVQGSYFKFELSQLQHRRIDGDVCTTVEGDAIHSDKNKLKERKKG